MTEPCVTHGVDTLYDNNIKLGKRGEQRVFSGPEGVCQGTSADHARRVEKAVQTADDLFLGWSVELSYTGPRYLFLGWSAELSYTGPRYLFLGWSAELSYIHTD